MLLTISNLYPRPDQPQRGLFNAQLFSALGSCHPHPGDGSRITDHGSRITNLCLVPEWRVWRWKEIRAWRDPYADGSNTRYVPVWYLPVLGRSMNWRPYTHGLAHCETEFAECDSVLATWLYPDGVAAAQMARRAQKTIWLKVHGTDRLHLKHPARRKRILDACDYANGIICNSHLVKGELIAGGISEARIHVIPNGVDISLFRYRPKDEARQKLIRSTQINESTNQRINELTNQRIILFVGNLVPIKSPDLLLSALAQSSIVNRQSSIVILFLGTGPLLPALQRQARRLGIADRVTFLGSRPHKEVAFWMNLADCLCLPSRSEGMPNVVLEALASGLPVLATDVGDCRRVLSGESAARVVPAGESEALANGLRDTLKAETDRAGMAERHQARLSWVECAARHLELML